MPTLAQIDWEVVELVALALAALFAFLTVLQAAAQWRLTKRGATYDLVVLDPIRLAADEFGKVSLRLITEHVQQMRTSAHEKDANQTVGPLIEDFNDSYFTFKSRVSRAARSWPFDPLSDVDDAVLAVQDKLTPLLATLPSAHVDLADELDAGLAEVMAVVLKHSPALKRGLLKRLRSWAAEMISVARSDDRRKRIRRKWSREYDVGTPRQRP